VGEFLKGCVMEDERNISMSFTKSEFIHVQAALRNEIKWRVDSFLTYSGFLVVEDLVKLLGRTYECRDDYEEAKKAKE
jgi:hypothetical protein